MHWHRNWVICLACTCDFRGGTDEILVGAIGKIVLDMTGYTLDQITGSMMADRAAFGVAEDLAFEKEACLLHDGDKLGLAATGALVRNKHRIKINSWPEGVALLTKIRHLVKHFSYGQRQTDLKKGVSACRSCRGEIGY